MLNIKVSAQLKNYTLIQDNITGNIHLYSYNKCIAYYDGKLWLNNEKDKFTPMSKLHLSWFKEFLHNKLT